MAEEQNPAYTKDLVSKLAEAATLVAKPVATAAGEVKPIQRFGRYTFSSPQAAAEFMQSPTFTQFWDKNNVGKENIGVRAEVNDARRYNNPRPRQTYTQAVDKHKANHSRGLAVAADAKAKGLGYSPPEVYDKRLAYNLAKERSVGRFYTNLSANSATKDLGFYLTPVSKQDGTYPIRLIADKRYGNFSLAGRPNYDGLINTTGMSHDDALIARRALDLSRRTGVDLGAALSSNTKSEAFVPSGMARPASSGGASRVVGTVANNTGDVTLFGMPKVSVANQNLKNILPFMGQSMAKASPYLGVVGTGVMAYQGYNDYNSDNMNTREYGATDPFGLRAGYDLGINVLSGQQSVADAWETQRRLVADPEFQIRNPLSSVIYNTAHGNFDTLKAFAGGYIPEFLK
jgi:hypothetical protein